MLAEIESKEEREKKDLSEASKSHIYYNGSTQVNLELVIPS